MALEQADGGKERMKFWFEGELEETDSDKQCCKCRVWVKAPKHYDVLPHHVFCEFELRGGGTPHPDELHPEPTGRIMCSPCGEMILV